MKVKAHPKKHPTEVKHHEEEKKEVQEVLNEEKAPEVSAPVEEKPEPSHFKEKPEAPLSQRIAESRKALEQPLPVGMAFFETPEGEIILGEATTNQVWSRSMNKGKGGWANKRR